MLKKYKLISIFLMMIITSFISLYNSANHVIASSVQISSGAVNEMPWEKDELFQKTIQESQTLVKMAGFCTVLKDPLPGEEENVHLAAQMLSGIIIAPGEVFSQNKKVGPYSTSRGFKSGPTYVGTSLVTSIGGGVCKIASTLYNTAVLSNLSIIERHPHTMPVPYVPYGQDATVAYGAKDFKFKNNTQFPIVIWAQGIENRLYIAFYGKEAPPKVEWHHEMLEVRKVSPLYKINPELEQGSEKILLDGMDGAVVKSWVDIYEKDGEIITRNLGTSYYNPMPKVIEKSNR